MKRMPKSQSTIQGAPAPAEGLPPHSPLPWHIEQCAGDRVQVTAANGEIVMEADGTNPVDAANIGLILAAVNEKDDPFFQAVASFIAEDIQPTGGA